VISARLGQRPKKMLQDNLAGSNQERIESRLAEVCIGRERVANPQQVHHPEAEAVREGPVLIMMLQKEPLRLGKPFGIHPLNPACRRGQDDCKQVDGEVAYPRAFSSVAVSSST
jgi:hypothetical protein